MNLVNESPWNKNKTTLSKWVKFIYHIHITEKQTYNERTTSVMDVTLNDIWKTCTSSIHK